MSVWQDQANGELGDSQIQTLRRHRHPALELPEPGDDWAAAETNLDRRDIQVLMQANAIQHHSWEKVHPEREYSGGAYQRQRWTTDRDVYEWIQANLTDTDECPGEGCHATGVSNPRGVEGYRCTNDNCGERLTEAQARELIR